MTITVIDRCDGVTSWDILDRDGKSVGMMQNEVSDGNFNSTSYARRWIVTGYTVELDEGSTEYFNAGQHGSARKAFAAARQFIKGL